MVAGLSNGVCDHALVFELGARGLMNSRVNKPQAVRVLPYEFIDTSNCHQHLTVAVGASVIDFHPLLSLLPNRSALHLNASFFLGIPGTKFDVDVVHIRKG